MERDSRDQRNDGGDGTDHVHGPTSDDMSDAAVLTYLMANPDFLIRHPALVRHLTPPSRFADGTAAATGNSGGAVVDMQGFMVSRLQADLARARDNHNQLIQSARSNLTTQTQIHDAALATLDARTFEHFIHIVTHDLPQILDVDAITLCVESTGVDADGGASATPGVRTLPPGRIDDLIGAGQRVILRDAVAADEALFGPATGLVRSDALVRLVANSTAPAALLAFGSREAGRFHAAQGTELLTFLAQVLERGLRRWLNLPDA